jgi:uncharacterized membrane protein YedE/YeeE
MDLLFQVRWSPYLVGCGIGVLSWLAFLLSDKPLGCSTAFARTSGMLEKMVSGSNVENRPYFKEFLPVIDWEWMLVLGVVVGAFLSSTMSGSFSPDLVPSLWEDAFGPRAFPRLVSAFNGGILIGFGARWAGGCTSGHGISGTLQLALSGWIAVASFFVGGVITALIVY